MAQDQAEEIIKSVRANFTEEDLRHPNVSLVEFVTFLSKYPDSHIVMSLVNVHWRPIEFMCFPCAMK